MTSVEEFITARTSIETLAAKIAQSVGDHAVGQSKEQLQEANRQLDTLKTMVANDVQVIVAGQLSRQLANLGAKVDTMAAKEPVKKAGVQKKTPRKTSVRAATDQ